MSEHAADFQLPKNIERTLAMLSRIYAQERELQLQEIIVNSKIHIEEGCSYDNWNGGTYGHAVYLTLPAQLFAFSLKQTVAFQEKIRTDLNELQRVPNEFIEKVSFDLDVEEDTDWRKNSGVLVSGKRVVPEDAEVRIWGATGSFRIFLSHISKFKVETAALKERLALFGVSCFVAHKDIKVSKEWQDEIELALASMDGFVALLTEKVHESSWTDQEVGFAFARRVPIVAVRLGMDPYGFIGKFQGLASKWPNCALDLAKVLIKHNRMFSPYVRALRRIADWDDGNLLGLVLSEIEHLTSSQIDELVAAYNETYKLRQCFVFNGRGHSSYGPGLPHHLNRIGTRKFGFDDSGLIQTVP
jgi:hypothetical protein